MTIVIYEPSAHERERDTARLERLIDDLLVYLRRRKAGNWSMRQRPLGPAATATAFRSDLFDIWFEDIEIEVFTLRLIEDGPEVVSARIIADVKRRERVRAERARKERRP